MCQAIAAASQFALASLSMVDMKEVLRRQLKGDASSALSNKFSPESEHQLLDTGKVLFLRFRQYFYISSTCSLVFTSLYKQAWQQVCSNIDATGFVLARCEDCGIHSLSGSVAQLSDPDR